MREDCCTLEGLPWSVKRWAHFEPDDVGLSLLSSSRLWIRWHTAKHASQFTLNTTQISVWFWLSGAHQRLTVLACISPRQCPFGANCVLHSKERNEWVIIDHLCSPYLSLATTISALTQQSSQEELSVRNVLQSLRLKYSWGQSDLRLQRGLTPPSGSGNLSHCGGSRADGRHARRSELGDSSIMFSRCLLQKESVLNLQVLQAFSHMLHMRRFRPAQNWRFLQDDTSWITTTRVFLFLLRAK